MTPHNYAGTHDYADPSHSGGGTDQVDIDAQGDLPASAVLWPGDTGRLADRSRRALLKLIEGPYLSRERAPQVWEALLADQAEIRSRLHDLFLDLVLDTDAEVAFVRSVAASDNDFPRAVRTQSLKFLETAMLLALRQRLIAEDRDGRVIIGQDELYEILQVYRTKDRDEADFAKRLNAAWGTMVRDLRVLHQLGSTSAAGPVRAEISPVVRLLVDADRVREFRATYEAIAAGHKPWTADDSDSKAAGEGDA